MASTAGGGCWSKQGMDRGINIEGRIGITGGEETAGLRPALVISFGLGLK